MCPQGHGVVHGHPDERQRLDWLGSQPTARGQCWRFMARDVWCSIASLRNLSTRTYILYLAVTQREAVESQTPWLMIAPGKR